MKLLSSVLKSKSSSEMEVICSPEVFLAFHLITWHSVQKGGTVQSKVDFWTKEKKDARRKILSKSSQFKLWLVYSDF